MPATAAARWKGFGGVRDRLRYACPEMPEEVNWDRLAAEMKANIHVGLAAGECVGAAEPQARRLDWRAAAVALPVAALVLAGVWLESRVRPRTSPLGGRHRDRRRPPAVSN